MTRALNALMPTHHAGAIRPSNPQEWIEDGWQMADDEQAALRETIFLTLAVLALGAQFWLGTVRGLFLAALTPTDVGPVTHALTMAAPILRYSLGMLAVVSECLCGYKLHRARTQLYS